VTWLSDSQDWSGIQEWKRRTQVALTGHVCPLEARESKPPNEQATICASIRNRWRTMQIRSCPPCLPP